MQLHELQAMIKKPIVNLSINDVREKDRPFIKAIKSGASTTPQIKDKVSSNASSAYINDRLRRLISLGYITRAKQQSGRAQIWHYALNQGVTIE